MAVEQISFPLEWMEQYRFSDNWWNGGFSPIRAGAPEGYISFLGMPAGAREAVKTSKTPAKIWLRLYFTKGGSFKVGKHQLSSRPTQSTKPYHYTLNNSFTPSVLNQYRDYEITSVIRDDLISGKFQGVTMWNDMGTPASECYGALDSPQRAYYMIEGDWNVAPDRPKLTYPTFGVSVDKEVTVKWNPPANETKPNTLSYDVAIATDGVNYKYYWNATSNGITEFKINTSLADQTRKAIIAVRAYDGEFYSPWEYSERFIIFHNTAPKAPTGLTPVVGKTIDRTAINTFAWKADPKAIQMGYQFRWRTVASDGTRGSWNYMPSSTTFVNSTSQYYNMPANTIPVGNFEWAVKTQDDFNLQSNYTTEQLAISANPSTAPNMVVPTFGMVHPQATMVSEWTSIDQTQFEFFLKSSGGTTLWSTTGTTERSVKIGYTLSSGTSYKIQVRVNSSGVWSSFVTTDFSVNFASPAYPAIHHIEEAGSGVTNVFYSSGEYNLLTPFADKEGNLLSPWSFYSINAVGESVTDVGEDSFTYTSVTNGVVGILGNFTSSELSLKAGDTYRLLSSSDKLGSRVRLRALDKSGTSLRSSYYPLTENDPPVLHGECQIVIPANTETLEVTFYNTSSYTAGSPVKTSQCRLMSVSPVSTDSIEVYRREYTPQGTEDWEYLGKDNTLSEVTKNLATPINEWSYSPQSGVTISFPHSYRIEATYTGVAGNWNIHKQMLPLKAGETYTLSVDQVTENGQCYIRVTTTDEAPLNPNKYYMLRESTSMTFKVPDNYVDGTAYIALGLRDGLTGTPANEGSFTIENPMVSVGAFSPFEPYYKPLIKGGFLDYTPASQTLYEYKLVAWNLTNNTQSESTFLRFMHSFSDTIIQDVDHMYDLYFLTMVTDRDSSTEVDSALQRFAGRKDPVREYGENETTELSIEWEVDSYFEAKQVSDLLNKREVYLYRDGSGRKMFVSTDKVNMKDKKISGFEMSCEFIKTHYDSGNTTN